MTINLLPYRERAQIKEGARFLALLLLMMMLTLTCCITHYNHYHTQFKKAIIAQQQCRIRVEQLRKKYSCNLKEESNRHLLIFIKKALTLQHQLIALFRLLEKTMPIGMHLTRLSYKNSHIALSGESIAAALVFHFIAVLKKIKFLRTVALKKLQQQKERMIFTITLQQSNAIT